MKHIPKKRFGQHFLADASVVDAIVTGLQCVIAVYFVVAVVAPWSNR